MPAAPTPDPGPETSKAEWRRIMRAGRREARTQQPEAARLLMQHLLAARIVPQGATVAGYAPMPDELDVLPLLAELDRRGCTTALPVVAGPKGTPLLFRQWRPGDALEPASFGLREPVATAPAVEPSVILLPCLAVDRSGVRLGQGGGYYDATLRTLRARGPILAVAILFSAQRVPRLPYEAATDECVDWIASEAGIERVSA